MGHWELTRGICSCLQKQYYQWRENKIQMLKAVHKTELIPLPQEYLSVVPD